MPYLGNRVSNDAKAWVRRVPTGPLEICAELPTHVQMAFTARVKAMHHWIRKGNSQKAAMSARDAAHIANVYLDGR